jgi:hypothetical protein
MTRLLRQDEGSFAGPQQLQPLANLQFLLGRVVLQLKDALAAVVVLALQSRVILFQFANLIPLFPERGNALGAAQRPVTERRDQREDNQECDAAGYFFDWQRM